jgi:hypothetical protein
MKKQTSEVIRGESLVNYVNGVLNLHLDVYYRQVTVAMQEDRGEPERVVFPNQLPDPSPIGGQA